MNELTNKQDVNALAIATDQSFADDFGALGKLMFSSFPICSVGQPTSRGKNVVGKFNFAGVDWEPLDSLKNVIIVKASFSRVLYGATFDSPSRCGSDNGRVPGSRYEKPICSDCTSCFAPKWDNESTPEEISKKQALAQELKVKDYTSSKPLCHDTINLTCVDDRMIPFILKFQKTQLKVVQNSLLNPLKFTKKRIFSRSLDIGLKKVEASSGTYYEYVFTNFKDTDPFLLPQLVEIAEFCKNNGEQIIANHYAEMDKEKVAAQQSMPSGAPGGGWQDETIPF